MMRCGTIQEDRGNHNRLHRTELYNYINGLVWLQHNQGSWSLYRWQDLRFTFNPRGNQNILMRAWTGVRLAKERRNNGRRQQLVELVFDGGLDVKIMRISIKVVILLAPRLHRWRWIHPSCIKRKKKKMKMKKIKSYFKRTLKQWDMAFSHGYSGSYITVT